MVDIFKNLSKVYSDFANKIDSDEFKYVQKKFQEKFKKYHNKIHLKNPAFVKELIEDGYSSLENNQYDKSIKSFNEAILNAVHPLQATNEEDKNLFLRLLLGRSNAFFGCENYKDFLKDVNTLKKFFQKMLSSKQKEKFKKQSEIARTKLNEVPIYLENEDKINLTKMQSEFVEGKNIYGLDDRIQIGFDEKTGRGLFVNKKLNENEIILVQKPFASVLSAYLYAKNCYQCLVRLPKPGAIYPCRQCNQVLFCSSSCEEECWNEHHLHECTYVDLLNYSSDFNLQPRLALKLILKQGIQNVLSLFSFQNQVFGNYKKKKNKSNKKTNLEDLNYSKFNYKFINSLQDHSEKCPDFSSPAILILLFMMEKFQQLTHIQTIKLGIILIKYLQIIHTNSKYVLSKQLKPEKISQQADLFILSEVKIGCALYQTFSLINHSCEPNVISFHFDGDKLFLKVLRQILPNEQICISYGCNWRWKTLDERQEFLSKFYFFNCKCKSCELELNPICQALKCSNCDDGPVFPFRSKNNEFDSKCSACGHKYSNLFQQTASNLQSSIDLLNKINLLFMKGTESNFSKVKILLINIQDKFNRVLYHQNRNLRKVKEQLSICCKLLKQNQESVDYAEKSLKLIFCELNENYSAYFNSLIKLIDRKVILFKFNNTKLQNLDQLKLKYLKVYQKVKQWIDINLPPSSEEYIYFSCFLNLSFKSYKDLNLNFK